MSTYGHDQGAGGGPYGEHSPGQQQPAAQPYGQQQPYGTQPQFGAQYPQQAYGQYGYPQAYAGQYGMPAPRPGGVVTAAVLGFIWGALGVLVTVSFFAGGAFFGGSRNEANDALPGLGDALGAAAGILFFLGVLALAWTVLVIWGSVWAISGRSRVLLIVGGSIAIAFTGLVFAGGIGSAADDGAGGLVLGLIGFVVSIVIVALLSTAQAAAFFAAERARRGR
jgi:hypothetical protein